MQPVTMSQTPEMAKHPTISATGVEGLVRWMQSDPVMSKLYPKIKDQLVQGRMQEAGLGELALQDFQFDSSTLATPTVDFGSSGGFWSDLSGALPGLIKTVGQGLLTAQQISTANKVTNLQLQRAQSGLAPLNLNSYGVSTTPGFNVGLAGDTQKLVMYGGLALLAVIFIPSLIKSMK